MPWVTEEEIQAAKNMTAYEYLRTHQAQRLQKTRTRNEWQLTDHDSFKINELSSKWHWKSRDIGGVSALRFLIEVDGMKFTDAVSEVISIFHFFSPLSDSFCPLIFLQTLIRAFIISPRKITIQICQQMFSNIFIFVSN